MRADVCKSYNVKDSGSPENSMAEGIRNAEWQEDKQLTIALEGYVLQNLKPREILDFVQHDYPQYAWSLGTLSRRLAFFDIKYIRCDIELDDMKDAVREELEGPGLLLGYRSMQRKLREQHKVAVPRGLVLDVMTEIDPEGLECRGNVGKKKRRRGATGIFTSLV